MGRYQVTLHIAQDLLSHSLSTRLILWSAGLWTCRILLTFRSSGSRERDSDQKVLLAERIIPTGIMGCSQVTLSSNTPHGAPLERGNLDISYSIDISILWIEERDSDQKVLLAERIIPTGIMARYQVTLSQTGPGRVMLRISSLPNGVQKQ